MSVNVRLENIIKQFKTPGGGVTTAVDNLSLTIEPGTFVTLLGPSGCGKTTTLRMIAGFEVPNSGTVFIDDQDITYIPPNKRGLAMVFQSYALFPHLTVAGNVAYSLKVRKQPSGLIQQKVSEVLEMVDLAGMEKRYPNQLSGGQQQRVALARAIVLEPKVLLFDEPLSNLDAKLREEMRDRIRGLQQHLGITAIYVTHDQVEAMTMSDQIVVINKGRIEQKGSPAEIYEKPASRFVADFIGRVNLLEAKLEQQEPDGLVLNALGVKTTVKSYSSIQKDMLLVIRPEAIEMMPTADWQGPVFDGTLTKLVYVGQHTEYTVELPSGVEVIAVALGHEHHLVKGQNVKIGIKPESLHAISA